MFPVWFFPAGTSHFIEMLAFVKPLSAPTPRQEGAGPLRFANRLRRLRGLTTLCVSTAETVQQGQNRGGLYDQSSIGVGCN